MDLSEAVIYFTSLKIILRRLGINCTVLYEVKMCSCEPKELFLADMTNTPFLLDVT